MPDLSACSVSVAFNLELVESESEDANFVAATLSINDDEQEVLIIPVESR